MGLKSIRDKKWFGILTNIYVLVLTVFVIWMLFFDTNSQGKKIGLLGTARDISEIKKKENQLSFILENLEECIYNVKFEKGDKKSGENPGFFA